MGGEERRGTEECVGLGVGWVVLVWVGWVWGRGGGGLAWVGMFVGVLVICDFCRLASRKKAGDDMSDGGL